MMVVSPSFLLAHSKAATTRIIPFFHRQVPCCSARGGKSSASTITAMDKKLLCYIKQRESPQTSISKDLGDINNSTWKLNHIHPIHHLNPYPKSQPPSQFSNLPNHILLSQDVYIRPNDLFLRPTHETLHVRQRLHPVYVSRSVLWSSFCAGIAILFAEFEF